MGRVLRWPAIEVALWQSYLARRRPRGVERLLAMLLSIFGKRADRLAPWLPWGLGDSEDPDTDREARIDAELAELAPYIQAAADD